MAYSKILAAIDNRSNSLQTAKRAFEFAAQMNATLALVYVIDRNREVISADLAITPEQSSTVLLKEAQQVLDQMAISYANGNKIIQFTPEGFPKKEIVQIAREWEASLIIIGAHGKTGLFHPEVGSVADYVIKHSEIPVMLVPSK